MYWSIKGDATKIERGHSQNEPGGTCELNSLVVVIKKRNLYLKFVLDIISFNYQTTVKIPLLLENSQNN